MRHPDVNTAVGALKQGAYDYLVKPVEPDTLQHVVDRILEYRALRAEVRTLRSQLSERLTQEEFVADSPAMEQVKELVARVAPTDSNVVIEGETGTGKEKVAATIHRLSRRDIDVVFSDLRMAGLDGPSLFHEATRRDPKWKDQFVFMTGDMLSSEMREVLESTNAPRLAKPFGIMDVRRVLAQIQRRPHE